MTALREIVDGIQTFTFHPRSGRDPVEVAKESASIVDVVASALGLKELRIVVTGDNIYASERQRWDSGNNLLSLQPGVVVAYERNVTNNSLLRKAGIEVVTIVGAELVAAAAAVTA